MVACKPVVYEMCQSTPGVQYVKDGEPNWTPVVRKRKRKRGKTMHIKESTSTSSSVSELDIAELQGRSTIKNVVRSLVSTFAGVALVLVCHGYPLHRVQNQT